MRVLYSKNLVFISKPRCGSTSIRKTLDQYAQQQKGDFGVDYADEYPPYHPHITAPHLKKLLKINFPSRVFPESFICIRHPLDMLFSYYKYFSPDRSCLYNYNKGYEKNHKISYERWIISGKVGINPNWAKLAPPWITGSNFSPLSLEAHSENDKCKNIIDNIFKIEEIETLENWLSGKLGSKIVIPKINKSLALKIPPVSTEALERIRHMFPKESAIYNV